MMKLEQKVEHLRRLKRKAEGLDEIQAQDEEVDTPTSNTKRYLVRDPRLLIPED